MHFLMDASLPRSATALLQRMGHDAVDVRDLGMGSATDDVIAAYARLKPPARRIRQHRGDPRALVSLNRRFHGAICEAAHNRYLIQTLDGMHDSLALLHGNTFRVPNRRDQSDAEHRRIVLAIERRDADAAEKTARDHIRQAQRTRFAMLTE